MCEGNLPKTEQIKFIYSETLKNYQLFNECRLCILKESHLPRRAQARQII
jgi:hypothetical protein